MSKPLLKPLSGMIGDWRERMAWVEATMREMSRQTDPQEMARLYRQRLRQILPIDGSLSLSRRGLQAPRYRITRDTRWKEEINPWKEPERLPLLEGGLLAELIYGDEAQLFNDFQVPAGDPAAESLAGYRSVAAIPMFDEGVALNMVLMMRHEPGGFDPEQFPGLVWISNLFGR